MSPARYNDSEGQGLDKGPLSNNIIYLWLLRSSFWDIFLTFDIEVQRVWKTQASVGKYLFLINRYIPPILFIFDGFYQLLPNPSIEITCGFMVGILSYIFKHFVTCQSKSSLLAKSLKLMTENISALPPGIVPGVPGCVSDCGDSRCRFLLVIFWIPFIVLESLTVGLTAYKSWASYVSVGSERSPFVTIVYRDGLLWYTVIMGISIINLTIWAVGPPTLIQIVPSVLRSLLTTIASRILLNIRGMLDRDYGNASFLDSSHTKVSTIQYNSATRTDHSAGVHPRSSVDYPLSNLKNRSRSSGD
ncbi:hypothetical protein BKA70DRAFT_1560104 [Coprinopsis sp. MPI-PUGE-AT-0042]|nr:hypothetical protein BKA70DRAFT_1560104 [Coprinopsis sp. MPI-PUGE-AT-0042]